jgi:hypothetical protein
MVAAATVLPAMRMGTPGHLVETIMATTPTMEAVEATMEAVEATMEAVEATMEAVEADTTGKGRISCGCTPTLQKANPHG